MTKKVESRLPFKKKSTLLTQLFINFCDAISHYTQYNTIFLMKSQIFANVKGTFINDVHIRVGREVQDSPK